MKRVALVVTLALTLPLAAWANSSDGSGRAATVIETGSLNRSFPDGVLFANKFTGHANLSADHQSSLFGVTELRLATLKRGGPTTGLKPVEAPAELIEGSESSGKDLALDNGPTLVTVPEPGTLGLLGTGLLAIAGLIRRQWKNRN